MFCLSQVTELGRPAAAWANDTDLYRVQKTLYSGEFGITGQLAD